MSKHGAAKETVSVSIEIGVVDAEIIYWGLHELLCWSNGYRAALGRDDQHLAPMGVGAVADIRRHLGSSLWEATDGRVGDQEIPF